MGAPVNESEQLGSHTTTVFIRVETDRPRYVSRGTFQAHSSKRAWLAPFFEELLLNGNKGRIPSTRYPSYAWKTIAHRIVRLTSPPLLLYAEGKHNPLPHGKGLPPGRGINDREHRLHPRETGAADDATLRVTHRTARQEQVIRCASLGAGRICRDH